MKQRKLSPSAFFLLTFALGIIFTYLYPWTITVYLDDTLVSSIGLLSLFVSLMLNIFAYKKFKGAKTSHAPFSRPTLLIQNGVFSLSRNPVYMALVLSECGLAFVFDTFWLMIAALLLLMLLDYFIVRYEEKILESIFTDEYKAYKKHTRRWI
ncbi:MAG: isoprenylcysteine carboxylmethyltransferase family protein [Campylobacterota bacterium]|nr:isoprenylcysteine carboxylmethyltransferase family protein [Campylobacterota bacterium]